MKYKLTVTIISEFNYKTRSQNLMWVKLTEIGHFNVYLFKKRFIINYRLLKQTS